MTQTAKYTSSLTLNDLKKLASENNVPDPDKFRVKHDIIVALLAKKVSVPYELASSPSIQTTTGPSLVTARSRPVVVNKSNCEANEWKLPRDDHASSIVEQEEYFREKLGDWRIPLKDTVHKVREIVAKFKDRFGQEVSIGAALSAFLLDSVFSCIIPVTNEELERCNKQDLQHSRVGRLVGDQIRLNLVSMSDADKWDIVASADYNDEKSLREHQMLARSLRLVSKKVLVELLPNGRYKEPLNLASEVSDATKKLNAKLGGLIATRCLTIDDDHLRFYGKDVQNRLIPSRYDKRKTNGTPLHVAADSIMGITRSVMVSGLTTEKDDLIRDLDLPPGVLVTMDRGYTEPGKLEMFLNAGISTLGILNEQSRRHPVVTVQTSYAHLGSADYGPNSVLSFNGCGVIGRCWTRYDGRMKAFSVLQKRTADHHGNLRFFSTGETLKDEDARKFVRVDATVDRETRANALLTAREHDDVVAEKLYSIINGNLQMLSMVQKTAEWYLIRIVGGLTATLAGVVVKPVLKKIRISLPTAFGKVAPCIWKNTQDMVGDEGAVPDPVQSTGTDVDVTSLMVALFTEDPDEETAEVLNESSTPTEDRGYDLDSDEDDGLDATDERESRSQAQESQTVMNTQTGSIALTVEELGQATCRFWKRNCVDKFKGNDNTLVGNLNEIRVLKWLSKHSFVFGKRVYGVGVARSRDVRIALDSKDGVFMLDLRAIDGIEAVAKERPEVELLMRTESANVLVPCGVEVKTSKKFSSRMDPPVQLVIAGSSQYHDIPELLREFKMQMLHQAFVGKFLWNLLCAWSPTSPSRLVLIYYPPEVLEEYGRLINLFSPMFDWLHDNALDGKIGDTALASKIPTWVDQKTKIVIESQLPLLRAVYTLVSKLGDGQVVPPTHEFRSGVVALYDHLKGGTDTECGAYADAVRASTNKFCGMTKLTWRLVYIPIVVAAKLERLVKFADACNDNFPKSLYAFRKTLTKDDRINGRLWRIAEELQRMRLEIGILGVRSRLVYATPVSKPSTIVESDIIAAHRESMILELKKRARDQGRTDIDSADMLDHTAAFPVVSSVRSTMTPGKLTLKPSYTSSAERFASIFKSRPSIEKRRETRLRYWLFDAVWIRTNAVLFHAKEILNLGSKCARRCIWCTNRRKEYLCLLCGEIFCGEECFREFHGARMDRLVKSAKKSDENSHSTVDLATTEESECSPKRTFSERLAQESPPRNHSSPESGEAASESIHSAKKKKKKKHCN